jgi:cytochrome c-type biogenesis protein
MSLTQTLLIPMAFGLVGFVEPCSIGIHMLFLSSLAKAGPRERLAGIATFTLVRSGLMTAVGLSAAWLGTRLFAWQSGWFVVLGAAYMGVGAWQTFGAGSLTGLMRNPWLSGAWLADAPPARPMWLGVVGGLTIPACAIPLVAVLLGQSLLVGQLARGALSLLVFALALSAPLLPLAWWQGGQALLARVSGAAPRYRRWLGAFIMLIGVLTLLSSRWWSTPL